MIEFFSKKPGSRIHPIHFLNKLLYDGYEKLSNFYESSLLNDKEGEQSNRTLYINDYREECDEFTIHFTCKYGVEPKSICYIIDNSIKHCAELEILVKKIEQYGVISINELYHLKFIDEAAVTEDT